MSTSASSNPLLIANLIGQLAFGLLAMTICIPSMQEWGAIFGAGQASVQLTFSGYVLTYGCLQLVYGPLSDRLGRKRVLLVGLVLSFTGSLLAALAPTLPLLTAARVLQGAGAAAGMVIGRALVQDLFHGPGRTRVMAWIGMAMGLCPPAATILGGQLHVSLGWQANFYVMAVLAVLLFVAAWRGLPSHTPHAADARTHWLRAMLSSYAQLARSRAFVLYAVVVCMTTATFYTFLAGAPVVLGSYGVGPDRVGFYIMFVPLAYIAGNYATSRLVNRLGDRRMLVAGHVTTVAGLLLLVALSLSGLNSPLAFSLPLMLVGIGHGLLVPPALAGTVGLMPALAGSAAAVAGVMQQLTGAFGGYAVGLVPHHGAANLGWLMLGFTLCAAAALTWLLRISPRT